MAWRFRAARHATASHPPVERRRSAKVCANPQFEERMGDLLLGVRYLDTDAIPKHSLPSRTGIDLDLIRQARPARRADPK